MTQTVPADLPTLRNFKEGHSQGKVAAVSARPEESQQEAKSAKG